MALQVSKTGDSTWVVRGKAWPEGAAEPKDWTISSDERTEPTPGRAVANAVDELLDQEPNIYHVRPILDTLSRYLRTGEHLP